jgi:hypothetical protein
VVLLLLFGLGFRLIVRWGSELWLVDWLLWIVFVWHRVLITVVQVLFVVLILLLQMWRMLIISFLLSHWSSGW